MTLGVGLLLAGMLDRDGHKIVMTRVTDAYVPLSERIAVFERSKPDCIISIHANASGDKSTPRGQLGHGHETWYQQGDLSSEAFANEVNDAIARWFGPADLTNRGIKAGSPATRTNWYTFQARQPADILVELGFVTSPSDVQLLGSDKWPSWAYALNEGIAGYLRQVDRPSPVFRPAGSLQELKGLFEWAWQGIFEKVTNDPAFPQLASETRGFIEYSRRVVERARGNE